MSATKIAAGDPAKVASQNYKVLLEYIETQEAREVYFHRNSVLLGDFEHMNVGSAVSFVEEEGEKGPQASSVVLVGKHHRHKSVKEAGV